MKTPITRLLVLLLALTVLAGLTACTPAEDPVPTEEAPTIHVPDPASRNKCTELGTPLADVRVRRALMLAIDTDTIIEALCGGAAKKASSFTAPGDWLNADLAAPEYDPEKAKELLAEAGWPSDYVLDVVYYHNDQQTEDMLKVIGNYWEAVGVKAEFRKLEGNPAGQLWTPPADPEGDSAVSWDLAFGAVAALTESEFYNRFASTASNNSHTPAVEGLDERIHAAASAMDAGEQKALYGQIQQIIAENVLAIPLLHQNCFIYTSSHLDTVGAVHGNDQFAYEKDILNWVTDREDNTLYTDGGPEEIFCNPVVNPGLYLYQELVFDRLISADSALNPADGQIAQTYTASDDGKTVEFAIRDGLMWHDGEPLTAEDVKFTFELYMRCPGANSVLTGVLDALVGAEPFKDGDAQVCTGITVAENKIAFCFEEPAADAMAVFSQWPVLPKHKLENVKPEALQLSSFWKAPIGSGPYRVSEVAFGESCTLERWDGYWKTGTGNIEKIHMTASGETNADLAAHAAMGLIDYAFGKSTDDRTYIEGIADMNVTDVQIRYTRCFFVNQYPHESYVAQMKAQEETTPATE